MPTVTNTIKRPDGTAATDAIVLVQLVGDSGRPVNGYVTASDYSIHGTFRPTVNSTTAVWSVTLVANSLISPTGTRWKVTENVDGVSSAYYLEVPNGAGPYFVEDILDEAPGAIASSALSNHLADTADAHDASAISYLGSTELVATTVEAALDELDTEKAPRDQVGVLEIDGTAKHIYHGPFWSTGEDLAVFFWEAWLRHNVEHTGYWISEGYGGAHAILAGFVGAAPTGNVWNGTANTSFSGDYAAEDGEWLHYAVSWDGTNIRVYINGIVVGIAAFAGPRRAQQGPLFIGGSDHSNMNGRLAQVRGFESDVPSFSGYPSAAFVPQRHFGALWASDVAAFVADYTVAASSIPDLSRGFNGGTHSGFLNGGNDQTNTFFPTIVPEYVYDSTAPFRNQFSVARTRTTPTPASVPASALIFDSFGRADSIPAFTATPTLGSTEGGSLGALAWSVANAGEFGVFDGRAVQTSSAAYADAWVDAGTANVDVRVTRRATAGLAGSTLVFRRQDASNKWMLLRDGTNILLMKRSAGTFSTVGTYAAGSTWTKMRAVANGTTITVYTDDGGAGWTQIGQATSQSDFQAATGVGISNYGGGSSEYRWDDFTVLAA